MNHAPHAKALPLTDPDPRATAAAALAGGPPPTRDQLRSRRPRAVRARTVSTKRLTKRELELGRALYPDADELHEERPKTRAECAGGERPCPYVSCAHHLYLDVSPKTGAIKLNFPDLEVHEMNHSCALDVADQGGATLEQVGRILNLTRERVRQIEVSGLAKLQAARDMFALRDYVDEPRTGRRHLPVLQVAREDLLDPDEIEELDAEELHEEVEGRDFDLDAFVADEDVGP